MFKRFLVAAIGVAVTFLMVPTVSAETWPAFQIPESIVESSKAQVARWRQKPSSIGKYTHHDPTGYFLMVRQPALCTNSSSIRIDADSTPWFVNSTGQYRHPVLTAQCGLNLLNAALAGDGDTNLFLRHAELLVSLQDDMGAFRYNFAWKHHMADKPWPPGWASAMAQGEGLAVFARAWNITKDDKYLVAGQKALEFLLKPVSEGGVSTTLSDIDKSLSDYHFYEEYATNTATYTLNGFMFTLFGLHDWSIAAPPEYGRFKAAEAFSQGIKTLEKILPYYDAGNISTYDLAYITMPGKKKYTVSASYHRIHIRQLDLMARLTGIELFKKYSDKWNRYMTNPKD